MSTIHISAAIIMRSDGKTLLVRKRGSRWFMQPGGKPESGETPHEALCREIREELALDISSIACESIGSFTAPAANEPGFNVRADLFRITLPDGMTAHPDAEIEEICWVDSDEIHDRCLAPLTQSHVLPLM